MFVLSVTIDAYISIYQVPENENVSCDYRHDLHLASETKYIKDID